MSATSDGRTTRPVLVGGTGRSGTTVTGSLIGSHPGIWLTDPVELKFLSDPGGLGDLFGPPAPPARPSLRAWARRWAATAAGRGPAIAPRPGPLHVELAERLAGAWFPERPVGGQPFGLGLARLASHDEVRAAGREFVERWPADPAGAAQGLVHRLVDSAAERHGYARWVETTPTSVRAAPALLQVLPDLQAVHVMRDGRDVIASVVTTMPWGPKDFRSGLSWWEGLMRRNHRAMQQLPQGQGIVVQLEDLVHRDRDATVQRLFEFLGLPLEDGVLRWFEANVRAETGHGGRYVRDVPADELRSFEQGYEAVLDRLDSDGVVRPL